ncbi:hypothetical protein ABZT17_23090 [Streptomyces sp. NPDC005648]|uniref:hypothetical protein n=1 Tax=Streptomyces sp. NPDC005648 TaxID=3157044 RepID=UPI0033B27D6E
MSAGDEGDSTQDTEDEGSAEALVLGTKFVVFSTRHRGYLRRVSLRYAHVPHDQQGGEAAVALQLACAIFDEASGCMGVLYDGAMRGMHRDVIARRGRLLINKQQEGARTRYIRTLDHPRCRHELWSKDGRVHERVYLDNGTSTLLPVPIRKLERRPGTHTHRRPARFPALHLQGPDLRLYGLLKVMDALLKVVNSCVAWRCVRAGR